jgi:hypothetical protein
MISDNNVKPIQDKIFNSLDNLQGALEGGTPTRVGSLLYWEIQLNKKFDYQDAVLEFAGTPLELSSVSPGVALKRFAETIAFRQDIPDIKYLINRDSDSECWFLSWYVGKVEEAGTDFVDHCRILITDEFTIGIISQRDSFKSNKDELTKALQGAFLLTDREFQQAMASYANRNGWRLSQSGGYYFMPLPSTSDLYNLKTIFSKFAGRIRITPLIFCNDQDAEEVVDCIGSYYADMIAKAEQTVFETNMALYKFTKYWDEFKQACLSYDTAAMATNKISHTQYGKKLVAHFRNIYVQSSIEEYRHLAKKRLDEIKPKERITPSAIRNLIGEMKEAESKLDSLRDTALLEKCLKQVDDGLLSLRVLVRKAAEMLSDEVLELL